MKMLMTMLLTTMWVGDDEGHLVRNGGDEGVGSVTTSKMEIATIHKVQPGNS